MGRACRMQISNEKRVGKPKGKRPLGGIEGRIILKGILK
jgi:hypothetical protein